VIEQDFRDFVQIKIEELNKKMLIEKLKLIEINPFLRAAFEKFTFLSSEYIAFII
jgi:hypothetical protein